MEAFRVKGSGFRRGAARRWVRLEMVACVQDVRHLSKTDLNGGATCTVERRAWCSDVHGGEDDLYDGATCTVKRRTWWGVWKRRHLSTTTSMVEPIWRRAKRLCDFCTRLISWSRRSCACAPGLSAGLAYQLVSLIGWSRCTRLISWSRSPVLLVCVRVRDKPGAQVAEALL